MISDLRLALRSLGKRPVSTTLGVLALALGIGANAVIFSFVEGIVLRPLPYPEADRLVSLQESSGLRSTSLGAVAPRDLEDFKTLSGIFSGLAGSARDGKNVSFAGSPERLTGLAIEPGYLDVLGVRPSLGRAFVAGEGRAGSDDVVILSDRIFKRRFDGKPSALSSSLLMDGRPYRIVGVMPETFRSLDEVAASALVDYFIPGVLSDDVKQNRGEHILDVLGRLQPGVTVAQANAALAQVSTRIAKADPETNLDVRASVQSQQEAVSGPLKTPMLLLFGASALIFLIASMNVATLLAARAVEESKDVAVRVALGASRSRVVRESLTRSLLLASVGCGLGLLLAVWLKGVLIAIAPARTPRLQEISINGGVIAMACLLSMVGAALFGLLPALAVSRSKATDALRSASRGGVGRRTSRSRSVLVALEIGLAVLPLVGATLLVRSLASLRGVSLGFDTDRVLVANLPLPDGRYPNADARLAFFEALAERTSALPGVEAVGFANRFPLRGGWTSGIQFEREAEDTFHDVAFQAVGGSYFPSLGIALERGRAFGPDDGKTSPPVAVVSEAFVRAHLHGDALGQRFRRSADRPWITIVGVVADTRRDGKAAVIAPQAYLSARQTDLYPVRLADFAVRTSQPIAVAKALQDVVWSIDAEQPLMNVRTLSETMDGAMAPRRFQTLLLALFAGLALLLALVGVYGVVGISVAQRRQEIGVRMAMGARASTILQMVVKQSLFPAMVGLLVGVVAAFGLARTLSGLLFGVSAADPATFLGAPVILLMAVLLASLSPALRAARVEPVTALRDE